MADAASHCPRINAPCPYEPANSRDWAFFYAANIARTSIKFAAGFLVAHGYLNADTSIAFAGLGAALVGFGMSVSGRPPDRFDPGQNQ